MSGIKEIIKNIETLDATDLRLLSRKILSLINGSKDEDDICSDSIDCCKKCGSKKIVKNGRDKNGKQRYQCRSCKNNFTPTSFSVISHSRKNEAVWGKYISVMLTGASLKKCAKECGISVQSAFLWRHKILNALQKDQCDRVMGGVVEADETYFAISYKGNHTRNNGFTMPRAPRKRGNRNHDQIGSRACVMCAFERNGQTYGEVLGKGQPTIAKLHHAFSNRILSDSIFITDKSISIKNYFNRVDNIEIIQLLSHVNPKSTTTPPEVRGAFHIQNINNIHYRLKRFMRGYNGVATKYLNHYVGFFIWLENHKKIDSVVIETELTKVLKENKMFISRKNIFALPRIPAVA